MLNMSEEEVEIEEVEVKRVIVESVDILDDDAKEKIQAIFGDEYEYQYKTDKSVLGGIRIRTDKELFDGTVKKQLEDLKVKMYS